MPKPRPTEPVRPTHRGPSLLPALATGAFVMVAAALLVPAAILATYSPHEQHPDAGWVPVEEGVGAYGGATMDPTELDPPDERAYRAPTEPMVAEPMAAVVVVRNDRFEAGSQITLDDMVVTEVIGDATFYVRPVDMPDAEPLLVRLDEVPTPDTPIEGRYDVDAGERLSIQGFVRDRDELSEDGLTWVTDDELAEDPAPLYIRAERLEMANR